MSSLVLAGDADAPGDGAAAAADAPGADAPGCGAADARVADPLEAAVGADACSVYLEWDGGGKRTATREGKATRTGLSIYIYIYIYI